jgi:hypothetical protein
MGEEGGFKNGNLHSSTWRNDFIWESMENFMLSGVVKSNGGLCGETKH